MSMSTDEASRSIGVGENTVNAHISALRMTSRYTKRDGKEDGKEMVSLPATRCALAFRQEANPPAAIRLLHLQTE